MSDLTADSCGAQNPLMRLADHVTRDQSFRQEGLQAGRAVSGAVAAPTSINMGTLLQSIEGLGLEPARVAPVVPAVGDAWSQEFSRSFIAPRTAMQYNAGPPTVVVPGPHLPAPHLLAHRPLGPHAVVSSETWASDFLSQKDNILDSAQMEQGEDDVALREAARQFVNDVTDGDLNDTAFMDYVKSLAGEEIPEASYKDLQDFDDSLLASRDKTTSAYDDDVAFWQGLEDTYRRHFLSDQDAGSLAGAPSAESFSYRFADTNEYLETEDAFAKGEAFLKEGNIPDAVLCFEAAVQQKSDYAAAWERLGLVLAENEQESEAIIACRKCLELEPGNSSALLSLARSFTNEMLNRDACLTLQRWLAAQDRYQHLVAAEDLEKNQLGHMNQFTSQEEFEAIESKLLAAVQLGDGDVDPELQIAMGILFNISADFTKAVDCFEAALQVRNDDALLWNKLGATLANSRRSEVAVSAYRRALELAPGFVRARSNLSIACIEMGAHWEAIEHGLVALNLQAKSSARSSAQTRRSGPAESIWSLLRMAITRMDSGAAGAPSGSGGAAAACSRQELLGFVEKRDLKTLNEIFEIFS